MRQVSAENRPDGASDEAAIPSGFWAVLALIGGVVTVLLGVLAHPLVAVIFAAVILLLSYLMLRTSYSADEVSGMVRRSAADAVRQVWGGVQGTGRYLTQISREFGFLSLFFFVLAAWHYAVGGMDWLDRAAYLLLAGAVSMLLAVLTGWRHHTSALDESELRAEADTRPVTRTRPIPFVIGGVLLFLVADVSGDVWEPDFLKDLNMHIQLVMLCAGIALVTWGAGGKRVKPLTPKNRGFSLPPTEGEGLQPSTQPKRSTIQVMRDFVRLYWREWLAVVVILTIAAFARVYHIGSAVHLFIDEIHFTNPILHVESEDTIELLKPFSSVAAFPYIFPYMQWWFVGPLDFGRTLAGLRLAAAVFGVLNVGALYLMTRELFGIKTALVAAALLAVFPPHLQYSRIGLNNIADPLFGMLVIYFVVRGIRRREYMRMNFALAGAMLGLTQYWYEGGRLLFPPLIVSWMLLVGVVVYGAISLRWLVGRLLRRERDMQAAVRFIERVDLVNLVKSVLVLMTVTVIVSAPVYYTLAGMDRPFLARLDTAGLRDSTVENLQEPDDIVQHVTGRIHLAYLMHVAIPEAWLYYGGFTPMLLAFMVPFFFLGVLYLAWRFDKPGASLLLIWIVATWLGNSLMQESRISARYVVAFPALMVMVSVGMIATMKLLWPQNPRTRNRVLAALLSAFVVFNFTYYFGNHTDALSNQFRDDPNLGRDSHDALFRAARLPDGTNVHIVGQPVMTQLDANGYMTYLNPEIRINTVQTRAMNSTYMQGLPQNVDHAFFIAPDDSATLLLINGYFPALLGPSSSPWDVPADEEYILYYARAVDQPPRVEAESPAIP